MRTVASSFKAVIILQLVTWSFRPLAIRTGRAYLEVNRVFTNLEIDGLRCALNMQLVHHYGGCRNLPPIFWVMKLKDT